MKIQQIAIETTITDLNLKEKKIKKSTKKQHHPLSIR